MRIASVALHTTITLRMAELADLVRAQLAEASEEIAEVIKEGGSNSDAISEAKRTVALAYAAISLFYTHEACQGSPALAEHPLHSELSRVKAYLGRTQQAATTTTTNKAAPPGR